MSRMRDRIKERSEKNKSKTTGVYVLPKESKQFKPKAMTYKLDFVPYIVTIDNNQEGAKKGEISDNKTILVHSNIGQGSEKKAYVCPKTIGKKCPICEERAVFMSKGYDENKKIIGSLKPQHRVAYNVIDLGEPDAGIQFFCTSIYNFTDLLLEEFCDDENALDYAELKGGKTVQARFKEEIYMSGKTERPFIKVSKITFHDRDDYGKKTLESAIDLDRCFEVLSYEKLKAIFLGMEEPKEQEEKADIYLEEVEKETVEEVKEPETVEEVKEKVEAKHLPKVDPPKEKTKRTRPPRKKIEEEGSKCPMAAEILEKTKNKVVFGADANKFDQCDFCKPNELWEECCNLQEKLANPEV